MALGAGAAAVLAAAGGFAMWQSPGALWQSIGGAQPSAVADDVLALPSGPSIAVLPFDNLSGDPNQEYFADGITQDLIPQLAHYKNFWSTPATTFQYKGKRVDIVTFAKQLGADYAVEGSVRRQADSVRISAQLLDAHTGGYVWSNSYDRALTTGNVLDIQDEIAAVALQIADSHGEINLRETARPREALPVPWRATTAFSDSHS